MTQQVTLAGASMALVLHVPDLGMPQILYFGRYAAAKQLRVLRAGRGTGMGAGNDTEVPSATLLPTGAMGFFGWPAILGHRDGVQHTLEFSNWKIEQQESTLNLIGHDEIAQLQVSLLLKIAHGVLISAVKLQNTAKTSYVVDRCMAGSMVASAGPATVMGYHGNWGREFQTSFDQLGHALWLKENRRGRTSHDKFPALIIDADGAELVMHFGWSGASVLAIDPLEDGRRLVHAGELFEPGEMRLAPGETYSSPKVYFGFDPADFRTLLRKDILQWPNGKMKPRPVTLNTWEGNYFDHKMDSLKAQASAAAALGIERFVLDDGWFGLRDDDTTCLGDWFVDTRKYPDGLKPLVDHVTSLGMEFGIWFEPEMVNPVSELYRNHPDWVLQVQGRAQPLSRNQLVLDLTRTEVTDYLFKCIDDVLKSCAISYIKWDMNRDIMHGAGESGGAVVSKQSRALYALLNRVREAHPTVEIETCASGGGRVDYGILGYTHRIWTSDCTDALERLEIQRGAAMFIPPEIMGSHISAVPNHQTRRVHTLSFRAIVALAYHMGVELNPLELNAGEHDELHYWIALHKRLRPWLHGGVGEFQLVPLEGRYVWGIVAPDKIIIIVAQASYLKTEQAPPLRIAHALSGNWHVSAFHPMRVLQSRVSQGQKNLLEGKTIFDIRCLAEGGLSLPVLHPEAAMIIELEPVRGH
jgi:alpha-galactosidase